MESDMVTVPVRLVRVTKEDAHAAVDAMEAIFDDYLLPDGTRLELWQHYQTFASDVLIRFGELNPDVGYPEQNGHV